MSDDLKIEITDPGPPRPEPQDDAPYRSLLVPLVVVPAMIVMVIVLCVALFGLLSGTEAGPRANLDQLLNGGANDRQQAAFGLVRQILEYQHSRSEGREPEWGIDESFLDQLRAAREGVPAPKAPGDVWVPFVLSSLTAQLGDSEGVDQLVEMTRLSDALDPDDVFRMNAIFILGSIGQELPDASRTRVAEALIGILDGDDEGFARLAAGALQNLPSPGTVPALKGLLGSRRVDMRLQAALSLAELGDPAGVPVLLELVQAAPYDRERELDPKKWAAATISLTRQKVLLALAELDRIPAAAVLQALVDDDEDPNVRSIALELQSRIDG